jgi:hypothetical protein
MTAAQELDSLLADMAKRGIKIVRKDQHWFWKVLGFLVLCVTFGKNKTFSTRYVTTIHKTIAVPPNWVDRDPLYKLEILTHELVHVAQFKKYTPVVMGLLYLLFPLPIGLAYFRWRFEREAYVAGYKKLLQYNYSPELRQALVDHGVVQMTSGQYGWTWPFKNSVRDYFDAHV